VNPSTNQRLLAYNFFFISVFTFASCTPVKYTKTVHGQPLQSFYFFSKEERPIPIRIDTTLIYINAEDWIRTYQNGQTEKLFLYRYFKFDNDGIAFFSNSSKDPITQSNIDIIGGQYCYYKETGDELSVEIYDLHLKKFLIWSPKIYPDKIYFYQHRMRSSAAKGKLDLVYYKKSTKLSRSLVWPE